MLYAGQPFVKPRLRTLGSETVIGISLDLTGKKNGRGAYICRTAACFEAARKRKAFERSLKCKIPEEVYERLADEVEKAVEKNG